MQVNRGIKLRLEAEVREYQQSLDSAALTTERFSAKTEKAAADVDVAAARQKVAAATVAEAERNLAKAKADTTTTDKQLGQAELAVSDAKRDAITASQNLSQAERDLAAAKNAQNVETLAQGSAIGRFSKFIDENSAGVQAAGQIMVGFGGAVTGVGLAAIKTGISYNSLQQTTRKALTTLTGSAEAANAQMDKLDAFAKTSPFAKDTFIKAQQQMLAFGIESERVIPYLDGINDAVAAAGGNSQTIGEIAFIMAQISAASKITGTDLMQFGQRGLDAATLIGSQMGKTGQQIRSEITEGTLDATDALDALAAGMSETYAGAAAGVKDTFAGAVDRMGASWREFGAMLAEPLVSQTGGGALVWLSNQVADVGNAFRGLPDPMRNTILWITGVTGAASLLGGSFLLMAPRLLATRKALIELGGAAPKIVAGLKGVSVAAGIAGVALIAMYGAEQVTRKKIMVADIEEMTSRILDMADGTDSAADALDEFFFVAAGDGLFHAEMGVNGFGDALRKISETDLGWGEKLERNFAWLPGIDDRGLRQAGENIVKLDESLGQLVGSGNADEAAKSWGRISDEADAAGVSTEDLTDMFPAYTAALKDAENQARLAAEATDELTGSNEESAEALEAATLAAEEMATAIEEAAQEAIQFARDWKKAIVDTAKASTSLMGAFDEVAAKGDVTASKLLTTLKKNVTDYDNWAENIVTIQTRLSKELPASMQAAGVAMVQELIDAGPESAAAAAALVNASNGELQEIVQYAGIAGAQSGDALANAVDAARIPEFQIGTTEATRSTEILAQIIAQAGESYGPWTIDADGTKAISEADGTVIKIDRKSGNITIDGENTKALGEIARAVQATNTAQGWVQMGAVATRDGYNALQNFRNSIKTPVSVPVSIRIAAAQSSINQAARNAAASIKGIWGNATGGRAGLPKHGDGGRLPYTGLGRDKILGIASDGTPTSWVDDLEWIINRQSSDKYHTALAAINADAPGIQHLAAYGSGGVAQSYPAAVPSNGGGAAFDYDRFAKAFSKLDHGGGGAQVTIQQTNINPQSVPTVVQTRQALEDVGALGVLGNV